MSAVHFFEEAVTFGAGGHDDGPLVGVVTSPEVATGDVAVLLLNAGLLHRVGPQRMSVQLARMFAARGVPSLRFDCSGIGDSASRSDNLPFEESSVVETRDAMDWFTRRTGVRRFVLIGLCSGADQAFQAALADERVVGAVLLEPYPYETPGFRRERVLRPLRRADTWKRALTGGYHLTYRVLKRLAGEYEAPVDAGVAVRAIPSRAVAERGYHTLLDRGVSLYVLYTAGQLGSYNYEGQFWDMHPSLPKEHDGLWYDYFGASDHTFSQAALRELLLTHVGRWFGARFGA